MKIMHVVGARPNFMKVAPVVRALKSYENVSQVLVHTGQHYDRNMSDQFFDELDIPRPDVSLEVGSDTHAVQTAEVMRRFEPCVINTSPDWVLVYGDVNSTLAAALVCAKLQLKVGHVEAGLRSFDRTMPEEINRIVTDQLASLHLTPSPDGDRNLIAEGIPPHRIKRVGNVMIDTLVRLLPKARETWNGQLPRTFVLATLHRPSNVDDATALFAVLSALDEISKHCPVVFPVHPRTSKRLSDMNFKFSSKAQIQLRDPIGYLECLALQSRAKLIITDSGGIQEESTYLGIPCLTLRQNTERPITVEQGTNLLVGNNMELLKSKAHAILDGTTFHGPRKIEFWDGHASERIAAILTDRTLNCPF